jgi:hypothetical protein
MGLFLLREWWRVSSPLAKMPGAPIAGIASHLPHIGQVAPD